MVNYGNGKIYKIVSEETDKIYVGSTTKRYLCQRMVQHRSNFKKWQTKQEGVHCSSFELLQFDDARIILIEDWPCVSKDQLHQREQYWIDKLTCCVNNYNAFGINTQRNKETRKKAESKYQNSQKYLETRKKYLKLKKDCIWCGSSYRRNDKSSHERRVKHKQNVVFFEKLFEELDQPKVCQLCSNLCARFSSLVILP